MTAAGSIKLNAQTANRAPQMSDDGVKQTIAEMQNSPNVSNLGDILQQHYSKISKSVTAVDKSTGEIVVLKLGSY